MSGLVYISPVQVLFDIPSLIVVLAADLLSYCNAKQTL